MKTRLLFVLLIPVLLLAACRRAEITDIQRNPDGGATVTAKLTESDINAAVSDALAQTANPLLRDPKVDLQNGAIVINGEHDRRDGNGRISGSLTLSLTVQDGALLAQISAVSIEGENIPLTDPSVVSLNQKLADNFSRRANRENRQITFTSVSITNDAVEVVFTLKRS